MIPQNYRVSKMVAPPLSQTNYTGIPHRKYTISKGKNLAVVVKRAARVAPTTRPDLTRQKKTDPVRVLASLFKFDPRACPIKSYRCTALWLSPISAFELMKNFNFFSAKRTIPHLQVYKNGQPNNYRRVRPMGRVAIINGITVGQFTEKLKGRKIDSSSNVNHHIC